MTNEQNPITNSERMKERAKRKYAEMLKERDLHADEFERIANWLRHILPLKSTPSYERSKIESSFHQLTSIAENFRRLRGL